MLIPFSEARWQGCNDICLSGPEWWRSVVIVTSHPSSISEGQRGHGLCLSDLEKWRRGHGHPSSILSKEGGKGVMALASLLLRKGGVWPTSPWHFQKKGGMVAMTSALLSMESGRVWPWLPPILQGGKRRPWSQPLSHCISLLIEVGDVEMVSALLI